jgi:large repetitive protein
VTVRDQLGAGFTYASHSGDGTFNYDSGTGIGVWTPPATLDELNVELTPAGTVSPDQVFTLQIIATVLGGFEPADYVNYAQVWTSGVWDPDSTPGDNSTDQDDDALAVLLVADMMVTKTNNQTTLVPGLPTTYTVVVTNEGPANVVGAIVQDSFPAALLNPTFTSIVVGTGSGNTPSGSGNILDVVSLTAGSSIIYTVTGTVSPDATGTLSNTATVTSPANIPDLHPDDNSATDTDPLTPRADLSIFKTDGQTTSTPGAPITYTIVVNNNGPSTVTGASIQDIFPAELLSPSYVSIASGGASGNTSGSGNINDTVNMPVGSQILYIVSATVSPSASGTLSNTATVSPPGGVTDPNPGNNLSTDANTLLVPPSADLGVLKNVALTTDADSSSSITAGDTVTFTITVYNAGPDQATGVTVQDVVPAGYSNIQNITGGGLLSGNTITWSGLSLPATPGLNSLTLTFNATVTSTQSYTNPVQITAANQTDPNPGNNQASVTPVVQLVSDLSLAKSVVLLTDADSSGNLSAGDTVRFSVVLSNAGPANATGVVVTDNVPAGYTSVVPVSGGGVYDPLADTITWSGLSVAANSSTTLLYDAVVVGGLAPEAYSNYAQVTSSPNFDPDSTPGNGNGMTPVEDDEASTRPAISNLSLTKEIALITDADTSGGYSGGDTVQFTLKVSNAGPDAAGGVSVQDSLPSGYNWVSGGAFNPATRTITWTGLNVPVGVDTATVTFTATIVGGQPVSAYSNYAQIHTSPNFDPDSVPGDNSVGDDDDAMVAPGIARLSLVKSVDLVTDLAPIGTINDGDTIRFTLTVANAGPDAATGVDVEDVLPDGFTDVDNINLGGGYDSGTRVVSWANLTVPAGGSLALTFEVIVALTGSYTNYAQITAADTLDPDSTPGNDSTTEDDDDTLILTPLLGQPPVANDDSRTNQPPGTVTLNVTANDTDPNNNLDPGTVDLDPSQAGIQTTLVVAGEGTWSVDGSGNVTFQPESGFTLDPTPITYTVSDTTDLLSNEATITIDYAPVAADDTSAGHTTGTPVTVNVLVNDTTGDAVVPSTVQIVGTMNPGDPLVVSGQGTWTINPVTGAITFTPESGFTGDPTPISYTVQDDDGNTSAPALVTVDYNQFPPVAVNDSRTNQPPGPVTLLATFNDSDPNDDLDAGTVRFVGTGAPGEDLVVDGEGTWSVDESGNVTFTPESGFTGDPTPVQYTVLDTTGLESNLATITIDYAPVATDDLATGAPGQPVTVSVLDNDTTGDTVDPTTVQIVGTPVPGDPLIVPGEGTWFVDPATGAITFAPELNFTGDPTPIEYTVEDFDGNRSDPATVTVDYIQLPPVAVSDESLGNPPGPVTLNVTNNDTDPNGDLDPSTVDLDPGTPGQQTTLAVAGEGTWSVDASGYVTFTPEPGFTLDPTPISYTVKDAMGLESDPAFVTVTIDYVPIATDDVSGGNTPDNAVTVNVLANDTTGDTVDPATVQIVGTASPGASLYVSGQGTWSVNATTGEITFTPDVGFTGNPTPIQYTVQDDEGNTSNPATVTVTYLNSPPVAVNDSSGPHAPGTTVTLSATFNDTDPDDNLNVATVDLDPDATGRQTTLVVAGEGTWTVDNLGSVTFTPFAGFNDDPTPIDYTVQDGTNLTSNRATITIDYLPVAYDDNSLDNPTGTPVTVSVLVNDTAGDVVDPLTVQIVGADAGSGGKTLTVPDQGTWTVDPATGAITFTPEPGYTDDPDSISYTVQDGEGNVSNTATVTVDYKQDPPLALNDSSLANDPGPVTLNVTTNDSDPNDDLLVNSVQFVGTGAPRADLVVSGEGTWSVDALGNVTFTPAELSPGVFFTGDPTPVLYTVTDATGLESNQATIRIDYVPVATDDSSAGNTTGTPVTVDVLANDTTGDTVVPSTVQIVGTANPGQPLTVPGEGTWSVNPTTGAITFTPESGFTDDPTPIDYTVADNDGNRSDPATVTVDYAQLPPVAASDASLGNPPGTVTLSVVNNDSDPNGDLDPSTVDLNPAVAGQQTTLVVTGEGTWSVDPAGNVTFTPEPGFTADPTPIPYTVKDATGLESDPAFVTVTIDYVPIASDDESGGHDPGTPVTVDVLANDTGGDTVDPTTVQIVGTSGPGVSLVVSGQGTWSVDPTTGAITFTPQGGFTGDPTPIQYTVQDHEGNTSNPATVIVTYDQSPPLAANDNSGPQTPGTTVTLSVVGNDTDPDNDLDVATVDLDPDMAGRQTELVVAGEGTWTVDNLGTVTFSPFAGFNDDPTPIDYTVQDLTDLTSNRATITIDYVPIATDDSSLNNPTGMPVTVPVLVNDTTGDVVNPLTVQIVGTANPGDPLVVAGQGTWTVDPATGAITFTPQAGFTGDPASIDYTVKDHEGNTSNPATVTVDYNQQPPVALDDVRLAQPPGAVTLNVTTNDSDPNNDLLVASVQIVNPPVGSTLSGDGKTLTVPGEGTWTVAPSGNVTFMPVSGFHGDPTPINYRIFDATGLYDDATITIDYAPVAVNNSSTGNATGTTVTIDVVANDTLGDTVVPSTVWIDGTPNPGDSLVVPGEGTWSVDPTTYAIIFTPELGFTGDPTHIYYTVADDDGNRSNHAMVTVDYLQLPPVAANDESLDNPAGPVTLNVTGNDSDPNNDLDPSTVDLNPNVPGQQTSLVVSGQGTWSVDALGNVTFAPQAGFTADPTPIHYTVSDKTGLLSNQATITIDYVPVAQDDVSGGNPVDTPVSLNVVANDTTGDTVVPSTVDLDPSTAGQQTALTVTGEGTWTVDASGIVTFTPESGFGGNPTPIPYAVQDNDGNVSDPAWITVTYLQSPPVAVDDESLGNPAGPVTLSATYNDSDPNNNLNVATVDLDPDTAGIQNSLVVSGEGTWTVDGSGDVTFAPFAGFNDDPTPIEYTVQDTTAPTPLTSNRATITIDYVPIADNDESLNNPTGTPVTVPVLANDTTGDVVDPTTIQIVGTAQPGDSLVVPGEGTWSVDLGSGTITFTPEPGFTGDPLDIQYTVADHEGNTSSAAMVTVDYLQQPPEAVNDSSLHNPAGPVTLNVTSNDTDPNHDLLVGTVQFVATANPGDPLVVANEGTWTVDPLGNVTFTPQAGFTGDPASITYTVSDATGEISNQATITIDYVPVATGDSSTGNTTENAVTVNVLLNDTTGDAVVATTVQIVNPPPGSTLSGDGKTLTVPGQGEWTVQATGEITFTPAGGYTGDPTPIQYTVQDDDGNTSNPATVTIDYVQIPPVAVNDESLHNPAGPVTLLVTGNDTDANNDLAVNTVDLNPNLAGIQTTLVVEGQGTWSVDASGYVTFTPETGFKLDPTPIPYTVRDATELVSNQATITVDYVPVASNDSSTGNTTGTPVTVNVLANDTTGDTVDPTTVQIVGADSGSNGLAKTVTGQGTWTVNPFSGAITFTPFAGFTGDPTAIDYTVLDHENNLSNQATVTIDYNQLPPLAGNDVSTGNDPGATVTLNALANDADPNGDLDPATVDLDPSTPAIDTTLTVSGEGVWTVDGAGNVTFAPDPNFTQDPTPITYTVSDATDLLSNVATITVDYVPVATHDTASGFAPSEPATVNVLANDTTGDTVDPTTVQIVGTPEPGVPLYVAGEGTWTVNPLTGAITFTPEPGFTDDPTDIQYTVADHEGNRSDPATVSIDYAQTPPVAVNDVSLGNPAGPVTIVVISNDTDVDGDLDPSTVDLDPTTPGQQTTLVVAGEGTWSVTPTGAVTFTPEPGFVTDPTPISYTVSDMTGEVSNTATIIIDYVPVARDDVSGGNTLGQAVTVDVLDNDDSGDTVDPATVQIVGTPEPGASLVVPGEGTWSVNSSTGEITFTPETGFTGNPTPIRYTVQDQEGNTSEPAVVTVTYLTSPPAAVDDESVGHTPGTAVTLSVTDNDSDPDNDLDVATVDLDPATPGRQTTLVVAGEGTWTVTNDGNVTFTPESGFTLDPTPIPYTIQDAEGLTSNRATITIDYVPVATADTSGGNTTGTPVTVDVLANDTDGDTVNPLTVQIVDADAGSDGLTKTVSGEGVWTVDPATGAITFTPESGFTLDPAPISYTVDDHEGNTSGPATVTVGYDRQPPVAEDDAKLAQPPGSVMLNVTANDSDPNGDLDIGTVDLDPSTAGIQTILVVSGEGMWSVDPSGNVTFAPQAGFTLDPTPIPYTVSDATGLVSNQATITVDYVPVATHDSSIGNTPGTPVTVNVLANDDLGDDVDPTTVQIVGTDNPGDDLVVPGEGTWSVDPGTGAITFDPETDFYGDPTPIEYTVADDEGNRSDPTTVTVDYDQSPPVAVNDESLGNPPGPVTLNVTGNDSDPDGDLVISSVDLNPATTGQDLVLVVTGEGTWTVTPDGNVTFTPEPGFTEDPTLITYRVFDSTGLFDDATITIDYVPETRDDASGGNTPGDNVTVDVLLNDTTGDTVDPTSVQILGADALSNGQTKTVAGEGVWTVNPATGAITFDPEPTFTGNPTPIQYTVEDDQNNVSEPAGVTVTYLTSPPVAVDDESLGHTPGTAVTLNVTANDSDVDDNLAVNTLDLDPSTPGQQTTLTVTGEGTWTVDSLGNVTFWPAAGFTDDPTPIPYTVSDATGLVSNRATITVDYVPIASADTSLNNPTGTPVTVDVLANDTHGDNVDPTTVQIYGTANPGDDFVVPGQGTWTVHPTTGEITFTPEPDFYGDPTPIEYTVEDAEGNRSDPAPVVVDYAQDPPVAVDDSKLAQLPGSVTLNILDGSSSAGNLADSDPNGDLLVASVDLNPALAGQQATLVVSGQGTWNVDALGNVTFTPEAGFTDDPTPIPYTISDATGLVSNQATITIDYVPVARGDISTGDTLGDPVTVDVLGNDTTGDTVDPTTVQIVGTDNPGDDWVVSGEGTWSVDPATGAITFTPDPDFYGDPTPIQYTVEDDEGNRSEPAMVTVDYTQAPPVAVDDSKLDQPPGPVTLNILDGTSSAGNVADSDPDGDLDPASVDLNPGADGRQTTLVVSGQGTWSVDAAGNVTFTPEAGFTGDPTPIPYTVSDSTGLVSNLATITIDYVPVAVDDSSTGHPTGMIVTVPVLSNDTTGDTPVPSTVQIVGADSGPRRQDADGFRPGHVDGESGDGHDHLYTGVRLHGRPDADPVHDAGQRRQHVQRGDRDD